MERRRFAPIGGGEEQEDGYALEDQWRVFLGSTREPASSNRRRRLRMPWPHFTRRPIRWSITLDSAPLRSILREMKALQPMFEKTGGVHAAMLVSQCGIMCSVRTLGGTRPSTRSSEDGWSIMTSSAPLLCSFPVGAVGTSWPKPFNRNSTRACVGAMSSCCPTCSRTWHPVMGFAAGENPQSWAHGLQRPQSLESTALRAHGESSRSNTG